MKIAPLLILLCLAGCAQHQTHTPRPVISTATVTQDARAVQESVTSAKSHAEQALEDNRRADFKEELVLRWEKQHGRLK